ncbi:MAG: hypothetical protein WCH01_07920 [Methylococcaceae bacterium]
MGQLLALAFNCAHETKPLVIVAVVRVVPVAVSGPEVVRVVVPPASTGVNTGRASASSAIYSAPLL